MIANFLKFHLSTQFIQDKICTVDLQQSASVCYEIMSSSDDQYTAIKDAILRKSTDYTLYSNLITTIPSVMFTLFVGPWSDKFVSGRKIVLMVSAIGSVSSCAIDLMNAIFFDLPTHWVLLSLIPASMSGGMYSMMTAVFSYINKTSPQDSKVIRFAIIESLIAMASPFSTLLPNYILPMEPWFFPARLRNYVGVYVISLSLNLPAILWLYYMVNETEDTEEDEQAFVSLDDNDNVPVNSKRKPEVNVRWYAAIKSIFVFDNLIEIWDIVRRKRQNGRHKLLWLMLASQAVCFLAMMGSWTIGYQYGEKMFNWTYERFNQISATFAIFHVIVGAPVLIPIMSKGLKMTEPVMGVVSCLFWMASLLVMGLWQHEYAVYVSQCLGTMSAVIGVVTRTYVTRLIDQKEVGSIFSVTSAFQAIMPLVSSLVFTRVFNATLDTCPGLVYVISGYLVLFVMIGYMIADLHSRHENRSRKIPHIQ
ncbi:Proton-coupled folate transporter [Halotydeus destructor]|nr:Proton-coupled folate transporter [Halotydeus destructor]